MRTWFKKHVMVTAVGGVVFIKVKQHYVAIYHFGIDFIKAKPPAPKIDYEKKQSFGLKFRNHLRSAARLR